MKSDIFIIPSEVEGRGTVVRPSTSLGMKYV
jgi:hypothetical protein